LIKIILVDDHQLVRMGIQHMLADAKGIKVVGEAPTGKEALQLVRNIPVDLVLLDLKLPDLSGLEVARRLLAHNPDIKILVVTSAVNDLFPFRLLEAGVRGYITKEASKEELIDSIKKVAVGQRVISPRVATNLALAKTSTNGTNSFDKLSNKEMEVLLMIVRGVEVKEIAASMHLSPKTVNSYRYRIFDKMDVRNDIELTLKAIQHGVIEIEEV